MRSRKRMHIRINIGINMKKPIAVDRDKLEIVDLYTCDINEIILAKKEYERLLKQYNIDDEMRIACEKNLSICIERLTNSTIN